MGFMSDYINRRLSAADLEAELLALIKKYNQLRETFTVIYVAASSKSIPDISINQDDYYLIYDLLKDTNTKKVDIYIETLGGSGEAAEEIVRFLRSKFEKVSFVVSGEAKSAGTIMVLSADEILMTETGSLGPIDAQVRIGRSVISAYDYVEWTNQKREEAEKTSRLNPFDATMVAQISPGELSGVLHSLRYAEDLVSKWLVDYKFKDWKITEGRKIPVTPEMKAKRAKEIANELTNHGRWRSHGRSIKASDLESIGLKITRVEEQPELCDVIFRIQTVCRMLFSSTNTYKIFATEREKVFKGAVSVSAAQRIPVVEAHVVEFDVKCSKCGKTYKLYGKFVNDPQIDKDMTAKGSIPFPQDNKLKCECGFEVDLSGLRNDIEVKIGKKLIT